MELKKDKDFPNKFSGHLQPAFEYVLVQELILVVLAEEVRRLVERARHRNHCPVITLNMLLSMHCNVDLTFFRDAKP